MNLCDYISDRLEVATANLEQLSKNDEVPLTRFIEKLLNPNFIIDTLKVTGSLQRDFDQSVFEGDFARDLAKDITVYVKSVGKTTANVGSTTGLMDFDSRQRMRRAIETILNNIKNKPKQEINKVALGAYLDRAEKFGNDLAESWNKNEFEKDGDMNTKIKMLYLLNVVDKYITNSLKGERGGVITINMNGVKSNNLRIFVKFLLDIVNGKSDTSVDVLVTEFAKFANEQNVLEPRGGSTALDTAPQVSSTAPGSVVPGAVVPSESLNVLCTIPDFDTVKISLDSGKHEFEIMAKNGHAPFAVREDENGHDGDDPVVVRNEETYNPTFLFTDRRFHDELACLLLGDPELALYTGSTSEWVKKLVSFFFSEYSEYRKVSFKREDRVFERELPSGKSLEFRSFYDLLRLYNLKTKYGILPLDPNIALEKLEYSHEIGQWVLWLRDQIELYEKGLARSYPFVREFAASGGRVPEDAPLVKNPWRAWEELCGGGYPGSSSGSSSLSGEKQSHSLGGFFTDGKFGESATGVYKSNTGELIENKTAARLPDKIHNQYDSLCYLKPENTIRYIVSIILGFILSHNYADYSLYYDLQREEPFGAKVGDSAHRLNKKMEGLDDWPAPKGPYVGRTARGQRGPLSPLKPPVTPFGGANSAAPRYRSGMLGGENYSINRNCISLYRDIVILGTWYFKKIDDPSLNNIISRMSGRWSTINQVFLDMRVRGGAYQVQDINTIIFRINHIIREFGDECSYNAVLNDFIETFHVVLKAIVESKLPQALPLSLGYGGVDLDHYTKTIEAYRPVIELDSTIMERYNIEDPIIEKIYKIKNRYVSDLKVSSGAGTDLSTGDVRVLLESLNYQQSITKDTPESKVMEMIKNAADRGLIHPDYANIFREIYRRGTGENLPNTLDENTIDPSPDTKTYLGKIGGMLPTVNVGISEKNEIPGVLLDSLYKRLLLDLRISRPKAMLNYNYDLIESSIDDDVTNFSEFVNKKYEGTVIGSIHPMNILVDIYNDVSVLKDLTDYSSKSIIEYILCRYDPKRMSPIPNHVYNVFETLLANFIYMNEKYWVDDDIVAELNASTAKKIPYMDDEISKGYARYNGTRGDKILSNEISLLNSRVNILRTAEYFEMPPVYMANVYYNYFTNYVRKNMTPTMQETKLNEKDYIDVIFEIFKKGYFKTIQA